MAKTFEYVPFTKDVEANRRALSHGLTVHRPQAVGVTLSGELLRQVYEYVPDDCWVGKAEVYCEDEANVFVKVAIAVPAVGIVRVRKAVEPVDFSYTHHD